MEVDDVVEGVGVGDEGGEVELTFDVDDVARGAAGALYEELFEHPCFLPWMA